MLAVFVGVVCCCFCRFRLKCAKSNTQKGVKGRIESFFLCVFGANAANLILQLGRSGPAGQNKTDNITLQACRTHRTPCGWFDVTLQLHSLWLECGFISHHRHTQYD